VKKCDDCDKPAEFQLQYNEVWDFTDLCKECLHKAVDEEFDLHGCTELHITRIPQLMSK